MEKFIRLDGAGAPMFIEDIDTDAITPAAAGRSLTTDLGAMLFNNSRYGADGLEIPAFVLNIPKFRASKILVAGKNFGCGSSRERAVWALMAFGFRCIIAPSFAEIFFDNACQNGLLLVELPHDACKSIADYLVDAAEPLMTVSLENQEVTLADGRSFRFSITTVRKEMLLQGLDEISVLLSLRTYRDEFEILDRVKRPWIYNVREHDP